MYKSFLFVFVFLSSIFYLQSEELTLHFKNLHRVPDVEISYLEPIYVLSFDTLIRRSHLKNVPERMHVVKLPKLQNAIDTSFFYPFFTGWENSAIQYGVGILLTNHQSDSLSLWVDFNCNMDFTDDKNAFFTITPSNPKIYVDLINPKNPNASFRYKFQKAFYEDSEAFAKYTKRRSNSNPEKGYLTRDSRFWIEHTRLGILSCDTIIDGQKVQIGLMDWTCNGFFNDIDSVNADKFDSDRILIGEYGSEVISDLPTEGAVKIEANTEIVINNVIYDVLEVEETGKYIRIKKTEKSSQLLKENDELPDIPFKLANGDESSLHNHLVKGKFTLIDIWAYWCKGCILAVPTMKELLKKHPTKLNILALHHLETYGEEAKKSIKENEMTWTQGLTNADIIKTLLSSGGFPYYVLVDPNGRVCKLNVQLSEIEDIIKKWKK